MRWFLFSFAAHCFRFCCIRCEIVRVVRWISHRGIFVFVCNFRCCCCCFALCCFMNRKGAKYAPVCVTFQFGRVNVCRNAFISMCCLVPMQQFASSSLALSLLARCQATNFQLIFPLDSNDRTILKISNQLQRERWIQSISLSDAEKKKRKDAARRRERAREMESKSQRGTKRAVCTISVDVYPGPFMLISKLCLNNVMKMVMTFDIFPLLLWHSVVCVCAQCTCDVWNVDECQFLITDWFRC